MGQEKKKGSRRSMFTGATLKSGAGTANNYSDSDSDNGKPKTIYINPEEINANPNNSRMPMPPPADARYQPENQGLERRSRPPVLPPIARSRDVRSLDPVPRPPIAEARNLPGVGKKRTVSEIRKHLGLTRQGTGHQVVTHGDKLAEDERTLKEALAFDSARKKAQKSGEKWYKETLLKSKNQESLAAERKRRLDFDGMAALSIAQQREEEKASNRRKEIKARSAEKQREVVESITKGTGHFWDPTRDKSVKIDPKAGAGERRFANEYNHLLEKDQKKLKQEKAAAREREFNFFANNQTEQLKSLRDWASYAVGEGYVVRNADGNLISFEQHVGNLEKERKARELFKEMESRKGVEARQKLKQEQKQEQEQERAAAILEMEIERNRRKGPGAMTPAKPPRKEAGGAVTSRTSIPKRITGTASSINARSKYGWQKKS